MSTLWSIRFVGIRLFNGNSWGNNCGFREKLERTDIADIGLRADKLTDRKCLPGPNTSTLL